jgi:HSP20 family protein
MADYSRNWMWSEACEMLARAERMHQDFFGPPRARLRQPSWEPPVDVLETEREVLVLVALPGVAAPQVQAAIDGADLVVAGSRILPRELRTAVIHRLELPQGRFERRIRLPSGRYESIDVAVIDGCLTVSLKKKAETSRG